MLMRVFNFGFAGIQFPVRVTPCGNDLQIRGKRLDSQFKTDLVVTLAGRAVADGDSAFLSCDFHELLRDQRAGHGCSDQIFVLINGMCLYAWRNIFIAELIDDIEDVKLIRAAIPCALLETVELLLLSDVDAAADNIIIIILFQPGDDTGRIKSAGVCQYNFFFCHNGKPPSESSIYLRTTKTIHQRIYEFKR